ncbi:unnamed protein product [Clonostachys chloroleuca]|uniref:NAD(P)-binding protein n=1 Tax=Clonostachys chloroleuca TaxID=1926264 RepID=A0AA35Q476_9HYPO|nr:unnamed protein product [Clonostachys chloroleuca]
MSGSARKASAAEFLAKESRLDVLDNNAVVLLRQNTELTRTAQGYESHLGINNVGTFLFTKLPTPILAATAKEEEPGRVRVVWVALTAAEGFSHKPGGVPLDNLDYHEPLPPMKLYAGNYLHATELARRYKDSGIVSVALHPGNLDTDMWKVQSLTKFLLRHTILYPIIFGAYTELFAGLSSQVSMEKSGSWIVPWGRIMPIRPDIVAASKTEEEGGSGIARKFWQWANDQVERYV